MSKFTRAFGAFLFSFTLVLGAWAGDGNELARKMDETKKAILSSEIQQREVLSNLFEVNKRLKKMVKEKSQLTEKRLSKQSGIKEMAKLITQLDQDVKTLQVLLVKQLRALYKMGGHGLVRLIFTSGSSLELDRNLKIIGRIAEYDFETIKNYLENRKNLTEKKNHLAHELARLQQVEVAAQKNAKQLDDEQKKKQELLTKLKDAHQQQVKKFQGLRTQTMSLTLNKEEQTAIQSFLEPSIFEKKGNLLRPARGPILQGYGLIKDPEHKTIFRHKGIFVQTDTHTPVLSVYNGEVAFLGPVEGLGLTLIIDHGDHYYTVYGSLAKNMVKQGMKVQEGQKIALAGATTTTYGPGLYFEVRHFSEPDDPEQWLKGDVHIQ